MRIGIFGGSFDPIHIGHLWVAEAALESLELSEIRWIPTATSPLKMDGPRASPQDRLQMLRLAVSGSPQHNVDDREILRGEISYTVDTVAELKREFPAAEMVMIIGSDSLATMAQWREPQRLLQMAVAAVVQRGGQGEIDFSVVAGLVDRDRLEIMRQSVIKMPVIEISSSELRQRVAAGRSIRFRTPRSVEALIDANRLYQ